MVLAILALVLFGSLQDGNLGESNRSGAEFSMTGLNLSPC